MTNQQPQPTDPITAFWRDVMARSGMSPAGMPGMPGVPGAQPQAGAPTMPGFPGWGWTPTPDTMKRMQSAWFDAMAEYAEQYMRSPQFLDSMKRSMEHAVGLRQQMDDFLKSSMATSMKTAGPGATTEVLSAVQRLESAVRERLDAMEERLSRLEKAAGAEADDSKPAAQRKPASKPVTK